MSDALLKEIERLKAELRAEQRAKVTAQVRLIFGGLAKRQTVSRKAMQNAKQPRQKSTIRRSILIAMRMAKRDRDSFKEFMTGWLNNPAGDLLLTEVSPSKTYRVEVEFSDQPPHDYEWSTLKKLYSSAK